MYILGIALLILLSSASGADAACSGNGQVWSCTAGSTIGDVKSAISGATDGAVITFRSGTYSWNTGTIDNFVGTKGVTLICEVALACDVQSSTGLIFNITYTGTWTKLYRISGFDFTGTCGANCFTIYTASGGGTGTIEKLRFDHNRITNMRYTWIQVGATDRGGEVYGVLDHNVIQGTNAHIFIHILGNGSIANGMAWGTTSRGSARALYMEDNKWNFDDANGALDACSDEWLSGKSVIRFNTARNCRFQTHGLPHGGAELWEVYGNTVSFDKATGNITTCYRCIQSQGSGEIYIFKNHFTGTPNVASNAVTVQHYRSDANQPGPLGICDGTKGADGNFTSTSTYAGYPCKAQPGRMEVNGTPGYGKLAPMFSFGNLSMLDNTSRNMTIEGSTYINLHVVPNRDYYNAVSVNAQSSPTSPFNGTTGMGYGTLANRPTTCTHTTLQDGDNGGGVMYWAEDQGDWNQSSSNPFGVQFNGADGILYRCSAPNTWIVHYTPYTYPHPLQTGEGGGGGDIMPPIAPTGLTVQ